MGQFGFDCNSQEFGIPKGFNLVAVGELRDAHGSGVNILLDPERGQSFSANVTLSAPDAGGPRYQLRGTRRDKDSC